MDTHAGTDCQWTCQVVKDITPEDAGPLSRRVLVGLAGRDDLAAVDLLCADVLPDLREGDELRLGMAGFPLRISYDEGESGGVVEAQQNATLLQGVVKDAKVGESYLGLEPLTRFVSVTVSTPLGDVELCHPMELVAEGQRDLVKPGSVVSALCELSGNCAAGEYAGGIVFDEDRDWAALSAFFREGGGARLRPLLRSDCACTFLENRQEGQENALALLMMVREDLAAAGLNRCAMGRLTGEGIRTEILPPSVPPEKREDWVEKRVRSGCQVLITNPKCVETGLDLNDFTTLIFYSMGYNLFTLRQASRRSWRINQNAPRVEVYMFYYANTMQAKAMKLMASKLAVAGIIEGNLSEEGLAAMSDVKDLASQMAKELTQGIKDNVEDIAAAFKKMAILNPHRERVQPAALPVAAVEDMSAPITTMEQPQIRTADAENKRVLYEELLQRTLEEHRKKKSKKKPVDENQLSFFDFVA